VAEPSSEYLPAAIRSGVSSERSRGPESTPEAVREGEPESTAEAVRQSEPESVETLRSSAFNRRSREPESEETRRQRWQQTLDLLVEDYLRFHVEQYRGLRSFGNRDETSSWRDGR
jgi:hypothetical protein